MLLLTGGALENGEKEKKKNFEQAQQAELFAVADRGLESNVVKTLNFEP